MTEVLLPYLSILLGEPSPHLKNKNPCLRRFLIPYNLISSFRALGQFTLPPTPAHTAVTTGFFSAYGQAWWK